MTDATTINPRTKIRLNRKPKGGGKKLNREISNVCDIFPPMPLGKYTELVKDIKEHGLKVPIVVDRTTGDVIDGKHRLSACKDAGVKPRFQNVDFGKDKGLPWRLNVIRRHMSTDERADLAVKYADFLREAGDSKDSLGDAASALGVSRSTVARERRKQAGEIPTIAIDRSLTTPTTITACDPSSDKPGYDIIVALERDIGRYETYNIFNIGAWNHLLFAVVEIRKMPTTLFALEKAGYTYISHFVAITQPTQYNEAIFMIPMHKIILIFEHGESKPPSLPIVSVLQEPWEANLRRFIDLNWPTATKFSFLGWDQIGWDNPQSEKRAFATA